MPLPLRIAALVPLFAALTVLTGALVPFGAGAAWAPVPALWHLLFAAAAMPMIFAAIAYFVPVLTRGPEAAPALLALPLLALAAGLAIVAWFGLGLSPLRALAPWLGLLAAGGLALWMHRRRRACLGPPHPCLSWYAAALFCLVLGLAAVALSTVRPEWAAGLRRFHLHANLLGFMGLTALGTLQVLLPTVLGQADPRAALRLRRDLPAALAGALGISVGAAWWPPLAIGATALYLWPVLRLSFDYRPEWHLRRRPPWQTATLLLAALAGLLMAGGQGLLHGAGLGEARAALPLFALGFLLPLVSGAAGHLLPVWLAPQAPLARQREQRSRLAALARTRAVALLVAAAVAGAAREPLPAVAAVVGGIAGLWLLVRLLAVAAEELRRR